MTYQEQIENNVLIVGVVDAEKVRGQADFTVSKV
jgi:hypothetical protein